MGHVCPQETQPQWREQQAAAAAVEQAIAEVKNTLSRIERTTLDAPQTILNRIGKSNLEMRLMFHFTERRIVAHICICFVAYKVYKELERTIRELGIGMSVDKVLFYAKTIPTLRFRLPNGDTHSERLYTMPQQERIRPLLEW